MTPSHCSSLIGRWILFKVCITLGKETLFLKQHHQLEIQTRKKDKETQAVQEINMIEQQRKNFWIELFEVFNYKM